MNDPVEVSPPSEYDWNDWKEWSKRQSEKHASAKKLQEFLFGEIATKLKPEHLYGQCDSDQSKEFLTAIFLLSKHSFRKEYDVCEYDTVTGDFDRRYGGKHYFDLCIDIKFNDIHQHGMRLSLPCYLGQGWRVITREDLIQPFQMISSMSLLGFDTKLAERSLWYGYARKEITQRNEHLKKRITRKQKIIDSLLIRLRDIRYEIAPFKRVMAKISKLKNGIDIVNYTKGNIDHEYIKAVRAVKVIKKFNSSNKDLEQEVNQLLEI